jgi:hypothetical protein
MSIPQPINSVKTIIVSGFILVIVTLVSRANLPEHPAEYQKWEAESLAAVRELKIASPEIAIPKLVNLVRQLSIGTNVEKGERPVFTEARSTLLAIPGHAKYYENKIAAMRAEVLASDGARAVLSEEEARERQHREVEAVSEWTYINYCEATAFPTLALLPSPETVAVLGRYLEDPEGRDGKTLLGGEMNGGDQDFEARRSNAEYATMAIRVLGIEHPPARALAIKNWESAAPEEVDAWKDWWQEVKSGQRTYRFVGSTTENGPVGPVSAEMLQAIERDRRRDGDRAAGHRPVPPTVAVPPRSAGGVQSRNFGILAAAAIIAALWYFLRARNARPV